MRNIDKFILHVVHNWPGSINEAYSQKMVSQLVSKFRDEADDLNIQITDEQLKKYIERFDELRSTSLVKEKDIFKTSLGQLIRIVTASKGADVEDEDQTPDVVYHEGPITVWNGNKEENIGDLPGFVSLLFDTMIADIENQWAAHAQGIVDAAVKLANKQGVAAKGAMVKSDVVSEAIISAAKKHKCDLYYANQRHENKRNQTM